MRTLKDGTYEFEYDDHTFVYAAVEMIDDSYDDEFGVVRARNHPEIESLSVVTYMGGFEYDVTKALSEAELKYFEEWALERLIEEGEE